MLPSTIERFLTESPVPIEAAPYEALRTFWNYNFFTRRRPQRRNIPVLVISGGTQDSMFSKEMGEALVAVFPQGELFRL